ncbi:MAG: hypothetical protein WCP97_05885 [bacterium]
MTLSLNRTFDQGTERIAAQDVATRLRNRIASDVGRDHKTKGFLKEAAINLGIGMSVGFGGRYLLKMEGFSGPAMGAIVSGLGSAVREGRQAYLTKESEYYVQKAYAKSETARNKRKENLSNAQRSLGSKLWQGAMEMLSWGMVTRAVTAVAVSADKRAIEINEALFNQKGKLGFWDSRHAQKQLGDNLSSANPFTLY